MPLRAADIKGRTGVSLNRAVDCSVYKLLRRAAPSFRIILGWRRWARAGDNVRSLHELQSGCLEELANKSTGLSKYQYLE